MARYYTGNYYYGLVLNNFNPNNPVTIEGNVSVYRDAGAAVAGSSSPWTVTVTGYVHGDRDPAYTGAPSGIQLSGGGEVKNRNTIAADGNAVEFDNDPGLVVNYSGGEISSRASTHYAGVLLNDSGHVFNYGSISGYRGIFMPSGGGIVSNFDLIMNNGSAPAIEGAAGASVYNYLSGVVRDRYHSDAIRLDGAGTVHNRGTAVALGVGINLPEGGVVVNYHTGVISGESGIASYPGDAPSLSVNNSGTISGIMAGINAQVYSLTVTNASGGTISGGSGIFASNPDITNLSGGTITGNFAGVAVGSGGGYILNSGVIRGTTNGIALEDSGGSLYLQRVNNEAGGLIHGYTGIDLTELGQGSKAITNFGTISGNMAIYGGSIYGNDTVTNGGRIDSGSKTRIAIQFGYGNDLLQIYPGAVFIGKVDGGIGTNDIFLEQGTRRGVLNALGQGFTNFNSIFVVTGALWTVDALASALPGTKIQGGGAGDELKLLTAGTINLSQVTGITTLVLANGAANTVSVVNGNFTGTSGLITIDGGNAGNTVNGFGISATSDRLVIVGGAGGDHFDGGAGNDLFKFSTANLASTDTVFGEGGNDRLVMTTAGTVLDNNVGGIETFQLASGAVNSLTLANANFTSVANTTITVDGGGSGNTVNAGALTGANRLVFAGGAGADQVTMGAASAIITGGAGVNRFTFGATGLHTIKDFAAGSDALVFKDSGFRLGADEGLGTSSPQHLAAGAFVVNATGTFTGTGQRFAYDTTNGDLFYDPDGSGSGFARSIVAVLSDRATLAAGASGNLFFTS